MLDTIWWYLSKKIKWPKIKLLKLNFWVKPKPKLSELLDKAGYRILGQGQGINVGLTRWRRIYFRNQVFFLEKDGQQITVISQKASRSFDD